MKGCLVKTFKFASLVELFFSPPRSEIEKNFCRNYEIKFLLRQLFLMLCIENNILLDFWRHSGA